MTSVRQQVMADARFAGDIVRYHTWPCIQKQTNAAHTWHCMRIYIHLFGPMPPATSTYLVHHDSGELKTGDSPFPVKSHNPKLKLEMDRLELEQLGNMSVKLPRLSKLEKMRCKLVDLLEMMDFGLIEVALGNKLMQPVADDTKYAAEVLARSLPTQKETQQIYDYIARLSRRFGDGF